MAAVNQLTYEEYFKEFLINNGFIAKEENEKMINVVSAE